MPIKRPLFIETTDDGPDEVTVMVYEKEPENNLITIEVDGPNGLSTFLLDYDETRALVEFFINQFSDLKRDVQLKK